MPDCVVLDANGLLVPFQFKVNIDRELSRLFGDIPVFVPSSVLGELARSGDRRSQAALKLARRYKIVETELSGDEAVIDIASRRNAAVLTNDRELIRRLRELRIPVVRLRGEKYLVADDF
ncbi:MAG: twitching motility protein PilT [Thermoplasmata archaeon]